MKPLFRAERNDGVGDITDPFAGTSQNSSVNEKSRECRPCSVTGNRCLPAVAAQFSRDKTTPAARDIPSVVKSLISGFSLLDSQALYASANHRNI